LEEFDLTSKSAPGKRKHGVLRRLKVRLPKRAKTCFLVEGTVKPRG
jgi:hypothetical protein